MFCPDSFFYNHRIFLQGIALMAFLFTTTLWLSYAFFFAYVRKWQSSTSGFANHRRHVLSLDTVRQRLWVGSESGVAAVFKIGPAVAKPMKNANALKRWH